MGETAVPALQYDTRRAIGSTAMTPRESAIMDAWDDGLSIDQVAAATGYSRKTVGDIVSVYGNPGNDWQAAIRAASARLVARVAQVGGRF